MPPKRPTTGEPASIQDVSDQDLQEEIARRLAPAHFPLGEACVGAARPPVWARVGSRLEAPWVRGDLRFCFPVHTWDAWMVLGALAAEPMAKNRDGSIPQKWIKPLASRMVPVPGWWGFGSHPEQRAFSALVLLDSLGALARQRGEPTSWSKYAISTRGSLLHRGGRIGFFQAVLEGGLLSVFDLSTDLTGEGLRQALDTALWLLEHHTAEESGLGRMVKRRVLECLPRSGSALLKDILEAFAPRDPWIPDPSARWTERRIEVGLDQVLERIHPAQAERILSHAIATPYLHGLVFRGVLADGSFTMGFTEAGRRFLGMESGLGAPVAPHAKVTAAYDIVFGRVDPSALAEVALYAELTGTDHGLVARITRPSCQAAFASGISLSEIVQSLGALASHPLPANVATTLEDWARAAQPVRVRDGVLMQCPDEDTASAIERMGRDVVERIGPTEVFLADRKALGPLRKKAAAAGILI